MTKQFHGVISIGFVAVAIAIAAAAMFRTSWVLGVVYLVVCAVSSGVVVYGYCAKCACKAHCAHVLPGKAAMAFDRQPGPYTGIELVTIIALGLLVIGLPQFWLWRYTGWFIAHWLLIVIALVQVRTVVCRGCGNVHCLLRVS